MAKVDHPIRRLIRRTMSRMNDRGFSMAEIAVVVGIGGFLVLLSGSTIWMVNQQMSDMSTYEFVDTLPQQVLALLNDDTAWANTVADTANTSLTCLRNQTECTPNVGGVLRVRDKSNGLVVGAGDPGAPTAGLTYQGQPCTGFSLVPGNQSCPFRFEVRWRAICETPCLKPQIRLEGQMYYTAPPEARRAINVAGSSFNVIRGEAADSKHNVCLGMGGNYNPTNGICTIASGTCDPWFVIGFTASGLRRCAEFSDVRCPHGTVLTSLNHEGDYQCTQGCHLATQPGGRVGTEERP